MILRATTKRKGQALVELALILPLLVLLGAGTAMAGYVLCWFLGIERIGAAVPTLIALCLPPVLVTLLLVARQRERLRRNAGSLPDFRRSETRRRRSPKTRRHRVCRVR